MTKSEIKHQRVIECRQMINDFFENDEEKTMHWFLMPNAKLGNKPPMHYINNDKVNYLWNKIKQMTHTLVVNYST